MFGGGILGSLINAGIGYFMGGTGGELADSTTTTILDGGSAYSGMLGDYANSFNFANGGVMTEFGSIPLRMYSNGGIANRPQAAIFGEGSRPEAYVPLPDGRTIPVTMSGAGGGVMQNNNVNITVQDNGSTSVSGNGQLDQAAMADAVRGVVIQELVRQSRAGGQFYKG